MNPESTFSRTSFSCRAGLVHLYARCVVFRGPGIRCTTMWLEASDDRGVARIFGPVWAARSETHSHTQRV